MFVDRESELDFLNSLLTRKHPGPGQLVLLYGRRRTGKTSLLKHWVEQTGLPYTYWVADKQPAAGQRRSLAARFTQVPESEAPYFDGWPALWRWMGSQIAQQRGRSILILDELQYASEADSAILSALQHTWDQVLKDSRVIVVLCGSQIGVMRELMQRQSPLFGRLTGQWLLEPLPFSALRAFFPRWTPAERVAAYSITGAIPAYMEWLNPERNLSANIRDVVLSPGSMFAAEPDLLLYDELRELSSYHAILQALSAGRHTVKEISEETLISRTNLAFFLKRLQTLRLIERRLPVTVPQKRRNRSRKGRYHISDSYFRFFFRFVAPHQKSLLSAAETLKHIQRHLRDFVAGTFEQLCRQWLVQQANSGVLPFTPAGVGSHWSRRVQVDAVAINWESHDILLGECKWGKEKVSLKVVRDLVDRKAPRTLADLAQYDDKDWKVHFSVFGRAGLTEPAERELKKLGGLAVDLEALDKAFRYARRG
jgi:AAA+ ATPase superfamily predicted ATPase